MPRAIKTALLILLVALMPLRGLAAATVGLCAFAHQHGTANTEHGHEHGADSHASDGSLCSSCAEHCAGTAFAPTAARATLLMTSGDEVAISAPLAALGFRAEPLDRPPLSR